MLSYPLGGGINKRSQGAREANTYWADSSPKGAPWGHFWGLSAGPSRALRAFFVMPEGPETLNGRKTLRLEGSLR